MSSKAIARLKKARARVAALEATLKDKLCAELSSLPAKYGFTSTDEFIDAVRGTHGKHRGRPPGAASKSEKPVKRRRGKITDEARTEVRRLVEEGKSGPEIGKAVGISLPSVQNIKKALGLVKARK